MNEHTATIQYNQRADDDIASVQVIVTTKQHEAYSTRQFSTVADIRTLYRMACSVSRLLAQGYSQNDATSISAMSVLKMPWTTLRPDNVHRQVVEAFLARKAAERLPFQLNALRRELRAKLQEYADLRGIGSPYTIEDVARSELDLNVHYVDAVGSQPDIYRQCIDTVQAAIDRELNRLDYESEADLRRAESGDYAENRETPYSRAEEEHFTWLDFHEAEFDDTPPAGEA